MKVFAANVVEVIFKSENEVGRPNK